MGFTEPSKFHGKTLPTSLAYPPQNLIVQSHPGTGKTTACLLEMLNHVDPSKDYPQALCLLPTRELANQTGEVIKKMTKFCPEIKLRLAVQGKDPSETKISDHVIVGTPKAVLDWALKFNVFDLSKISVFAVDDADMMTVQKGIQDNCVKIHSQTDPKCQTLIFSSTYKEDITEFAEYLALNPIVIKVLRE